MSSAKHHSSEGSNRFEIRVDCGDLRPVTPYTEELRDEYEEAQRALEDLKKREEEIRKKAEELEEITRKEEAFSQGRYTLIEQLEEYLDILEREEAQARDLAKRCGETHQRFQHHLGVIEELCPDAIDRHNLKLELDAALRQLGAAEQEVSDAMPLMEFISGRKNRKPPAAKQSGSTSRTNRADLSYWLKAGLVFSIPILIFIAIVAFIAIYLK